jgi:tetratricopeptide (TPR) repeat protein
MRSKSMAHTAKKRKSPFQVFLKSILQILLSTLILLFILEIFFRFLGAPGASEFVERIVMQEGLGPKKPKGEIRIFTYGESTMHGSHYAPNSSPALWLKQYLKDFFPDRNIKVVNFSRMGQGGHFIRDSFKETQFYKPDYAIFYYGHNGFLPANRKNEIELEEQSLKFKIRQALKQSYFISTILRWVVIPNKMKRRKYDSIEYRVIETDPRGIPPANELIARGTQEYKENLEFQKQNSIDILKLVRQNNLPALFFKPISNLKDFAPYYSLHKSNLSKSQLNEWEKFYEVGKKSQAANDWSEALNAYEKAYTIDSLYADLSFRIGQIYFKLGDLPKAKKMFEEARDNDVVICRATSDMTRIFESLKETQSMQLIDTEKYVVSEVPGGILGEPIIDDNVHFSLKGQGLLALAMAREMAQRNWIAPEKEWRFERLRSFEEIGTSLGIDKPEYLIHVFLQMVNYFGSRYDNRLRYAAKVLEVDPKNTRGLRYMAWTYWLMGNREKALAFYKQLSTVDSKALEEVFQIQPEIKKAFLKQST